MRTRLAHGWCEPTSAVTEKAVPTGNGCPIITTGQRNRLQFTTYPASPGDRDRSPVRLEQGRRRRPAETSPGRYAASWSTSDEDDDDNEEDDDDEDEDEPGASEIMLILPLS